MGGRTRNLTNKAQRNSSLPANPGAGALFYIKLAEDFTGPATGAETGYTLKFDGTDFYLVDVTSPEYVAAHGEADGTSSLIAAANNTWQNIPWPVSIITNVAVCPLAFFTAGDHEYTIPSDGYYCLGFNLQLNTDPNLFDSTLEFGLFKNGVLQKSFLVSDNDWSINYSEVPNYLTAGDIFILKFRRSGSGYADPVDIESTANMFIFKLAATGVGGNPEHALNDHTDTNFPSPADGDIVSWDSGANEWVNIPFAHGLGSHTDVNIGTPGIGEDGYALVWDNTAGEFVLAAAPVPGPHNLDSHSDVNVGTPGPSEDGYVLSWDDSAGEFVLVSAASLAAHLVLSATHSDSVVTGAVTDGQYIKRVSGNWTNSALGTLEDLSDTTFTTLAASDLLQRNGGNTAWVNVPVSSLVTAHTLDSHSNVNFAAKVNGSIIYWDSGAAGWRVKTLSLSDLSDVDITTTPPTVGQSLVWNGTDFVPGSPTATVTAVYSHATASGSVSGTTRATLAGVQSVGCSIVGGNKIRVPSLGRYSYTFTGYAAGAGAISIGVEVNTSGSYNGNGMDLTAGGGGAVCITGTIHLAANADLSILMAGTYTLTFGNFNVVRIGD